MAGTRSALIVATDSYDDERLARLVAPEADARALAEVLSDPGIGGFEVTTVLNRPWHEVSRAVALFFRNRRPDDLVLVHFSCHGLKDDSGELYFAATDTTLDLLEATAVSASSVNRVMDRSRAGSVLLLLDCCYAGAFARGMKARAGGAVDVNERLGGRGRAVITASSALQFAFEGDIITQGDPVDARPSLFTTALVEGLRTGDADRDLDGWVSLDELYSYVHDAVTRINPDQTPTKWAFDIEGDVHIARRSTPVSTPAELPAPVVTSMKSLFSWERAAVVEPLTDLLGSGHPGRSLAARLALEEMAAHDDSDRVKAAARTALGVTGTAPAAAPPPPARIPTQASAPEAVAPSVTTRPPDKSPAPQLAPAGPSPPTREAPTTLRWHQRLHRRAWLTIAATGVLVVGGGTWGLVSALSGDNNSSTGGSAPASGRLSDATVVLTQTNDGPRQLVTFEIGGTGNTSDLVDEPTAERPTITPDRTQVVYLPTTGGKPGAARIIRVDGSGDRPLLNAAATRSCPLMARPSFRSNGDLVAMVCFEKDTSTSLGLWVVDPAGTTPIRRLVDWGSANGGVSWGDDDRIYFTSLGTGGDDDQIYSISLAGGEPRRATGVANENGFESNPDWGKPGLLYLMSARHGTAGDIYLRTTQGSTTRLTTTGDVASPSWSPDYTRIAWLAPSSSHPKESTVWTASFKAGGADGHPVLGTPREAGMSGAAGPLAWGSR